MKIQNLFSRGIVDKDSDGRFVDSNELVDAENFFVTTVDSSDMGVGKNALGNALKTSYNIPGGKNIGVGVNNSIGKIYNLIKGTNFDYVIEYDVETSLSDIVLQSTTGGVLNFKEGEMIDNVDVFVDSVSRDVIIFWSGDTNPPRCVNINTAKTWTVDGFSNDEISVMKPSPIFAPDINLTTSVDGVENNFIEDKMLCFATRYKYRDGYYSAYSSWSRIAFTPKKFDLDYQTYENNAMLNLSNAVDISFNVGPRDVIQVDLVFRESDSSKVYLIEQFVKENEGWSNNTVQSFQFSKSKIYTPLPEDQYFRNFDNVPLEAVCQTPIGNRIAYANFVEGRDIEENVDFEVGLISTEPFSSEEIGVISDYISGSSYSNIVDFEEGVEDGGSSPTDQMNYSTNTVQMVLGTATTADFVIDATPKSGYSTVPYTITVKEGTTVLQQWTALTGNQLKTYTTTTNKNVQIYITSDVGLIYDLKLNYNTSLLGSAISRYDYFAYFQLSFPKSGGYGSDLTGNTVIDTITSFDMTGYSFTSGNQIRINLDLKSSLADAFEPSVTFFYNINENYTDLTDFLTNSGFVYQLETVFSLTFKNNFISNEGSFVSMVDFDVSQSGNTLIIKTPSVVYSVTEPSTIVENKTEFYLIKDAVLQTVEQSAFTSLHSNRDDEVGLIYMDEQGRKTTILNSPLNTVYIPAINSDLVNRLTVTINSNPPSWAKYYKFAIKKPKRNYEIIYGNEVFKDGIYRWIRLVGENKNKIEEGDLLTVKSDYSGPLDVLRKTKVLEIKQQEANFVSGNVYENGDEIIEPPGMYFKIKQGDFDIDITQDTYKSYIGRGKRRYASRSFVTTDPLFGFYDETDTWIPDSILAGTLLNFKISIKAYGNIAFDHELNIEKVAQDDYADIKEWFDAEIANDNSFTSYANDYLNDWEFTTPDGQSFRIKPWRDGTSSRDIITTVEFNVNFAGGTLVFETEPIEQLETVFFETSKTYTITDGNHEFTTHILNDAFDCFCFGNGVESYKIRDSLTGKSFSIDSNPTGINKEGYRQLKRFADITYSEIYNSNTNVNRLNEFNLSNANYKDDIEKSYGPIYKIKGKDTNISVFQEDKVSTVYYGKDLLFNADGVTNLTGIPQVLGQQNTYAAENGISIHPSSYDDYATNDYLTDVKRGVVLKKNENNGLFEISSQKMKSYFKKLFRDNVINQVIGKYDQYHDVYVLNVKYNSTDYVTWVYSDSDNGWLGRITFNPENMCRVNSKFFSFYNGEIYEHNQSTGRNTFYGIEYPSKFIINFSQNPSERKVYKNGEIEGTDPWDLELKTDLEEGYIKATDFVKQEGVFRAYTRTSNEIIDNSSLSVQGIGNCTIIGLELRFSFVLENEISIGDKIVNLSNQLVGTIQNKSEKSLTLNAVANIVSGDYVMCSKSKSSESMGIRGYHMQVTGTIMKNTKTEIYAVNSEVVKSYT